MISIQENKIVLKIFKIKISITLNIEKIIVKNFVFLFKILDYIVPKNNKKIVFNSYPDYGDNVFCYYEYLKNNYPKEYELIWIVNDYNTKIIEDNSYKLYSFKAMFHSITSKYVVVTHTNEYIDLLNSKKHVYLNMWHGMPLKTIGFNEKNIDKKILKRYLKLGKNSHFFVTSDLFKLVLSACFCANYDNIHITGQPRTDIMYDEFKSQKIKELFNFGEFKKIVLYLPTYKKIKDNVFGKRVGGDSIFYFEKFNNNKFIDFLKQKQILFLMKPHPFEDDLYRQQLDNLPICKNFKIIFNNDLFDAQINLYHILKYSDLLITDFSSVVVDYLILNKPLLFLNNLTDEYSQKRGMILEDNYELLMPGHKVNTYDELEEKIVDSLTIDSTKDLRERTLPLLHKYCDDKASERIFEIMKEL